MVIPRSGNICGAESSVYLLGISIGGQRISVCPFHQKCHDQGYDLVIQIDQSSRKRGRDESSDLDPDEPLLTDKRSCPDLDQDDEDLNDLDDLDDLSDLDDEELAELEKLLDDDDLSDLDDKELVELEKLLDDD